MGKKIATVLTDMFEDVEYTDPAKAFKEAGHEVVTIEKEKGKEVTGKNKEATVKIDASIDDVKPTDFDALFIPGGFSPDQLRADERFVKFAKHFMDEKKPVFAICHGPQLLITAKTLEGRKATGFTSIQVDMEYAGATVEDKEVVVCQDQLVTSRQPDDIPAFNREALNLLK
ncbi:type 1 glutamine amidotransferase domain-containing protein [Virgibacillus halodenitrificans]|uniref:Protease n=1 Tax=Virgibacillus halodenitrificans TaxID=1482 RepID=A0AAC9NHS0_VIRHA|nr:type 1 glutamine amidotransferase domain-containing protein [Virgibacillus halodenitrificans]APC46717.1 protease [Virgibacillus halodenitrificans]MCG1030283.1 type 1 glutamine amidotransferase [Virgibacillus halodenitrificans]MCJ0931608.1 type 1 glutamine amidotransferase [Virgibacillus halodenitrificans]MEC2157569.1 type 1 glutamine amidotransferase [Virgibacillus halodenitrificans]MYL60746.1 DJ-1/PfpI/YhbO family deglycase/protease [Virgibacillus halodenitrificans]